MGHVQDLWYKEASGPDTGGVRRVKTKRHGRGQRYRARYIDQSGRERSKSFPDRGKRLAERFLVAVEYDVRSGGYVDSKAGEVTFRDYADRWLAAQTFDERTRETVESRLRARTYPQLGNRSVAGIKPVDIREWQRELQAVGLAASYRRVLFVHVQTILDSAIDDDMIRANPCKAGSVRTPRVATRKVVPWSLGQVCAVRDALPERLRVVVALGAGLGLRYGEAAGLGIGDIDFDGGIVRIDRGIKSLRGGQCYGPPKGGKAREVPLPGSVADAIRDHVAVYPPGPVTLPWQTRMGESITAVLILHKGALALPHRTFTRVWRRAVQEATGKRPGCREGYHCLRHFYASTLLDAGESIVALSAYLGHADPGFTLRTYTHLMPTSHQRTRQAVDALGAASATNGAPTA